MGNTTVKFDIIDYLDGFMNNATVDKLGQTVITEMKRQIQAGSSPVRGEGRYDRYAPSYEKQIKKGRFSGKNIRPVNLTQTGKMLDELDYEQKGNSNTLKVGFISSSNRSEIASYHNEGTNKMPKRQMVPSENQEFTVSIMTKIKDVYSERLFDIIERSNKK